MGSKRFFCPTLLRRGRREVLKGAIALAVHNRLFFDGREVFELYDICALKQVLPS